MSLVKGCTFTQKDTRVHVFTCVIDAIWRISLCAYELVMNRQNSGFGDEEEQVHHNVCR